MFFRFLSTCLVIFFVSEIRSREVCSDDNGTTREEKIFSMNRRLDMALQELTTSFVILNTTVRNLPDNSNVFTLIGNLSLTSGRLSNLNTMVRNGDVNYSLENCTLTIYIPITFQDLQYYYHFNYRVGFINQQGDVNGIINNPTFVITFEGDYAAIYTARLRSIESNYPWNITTTFTNIGSIPSFVLRDTITVGVIEALERPLYYFMWDVATSISRSWN